MQFTVDDLRTLLDKFYQDAVDRGQRDPRGTLKRNLTKLTDQEVIDLCKEMVENIKTGNCRQYPMPLLTLLVVAVTCFDAD